MWSHLVTLSGLCLTLAQTDGLDQEGTLSSVFSQLESVGDDLTFSDRRPPAIQVKRVVGPALLQVDAVAPSENSASFTSASPGSQGPLEMSLLDAAPSQMRGGPAPGSGVVERASFTRELPGQLEMSLRNTAPSQTRDHGARGSGMISLLTSTDPFKPLLPALGQNVREAVPHPTGLVSLLTSVTDPLKGPLFPAGEKSLHVVPDAPKQGVVSLLMNVDKIPKPQTKGSADVLGAPLMDDVPPQDFDHQDPEAEVGSIMDETPGSAKPPTDPKAESPLPPELVFLVPESERNPKPTVEASPPVWSSHWKPGDPAAGLERKPAKPTAKPSISAILRKMEEGRQSLLRDANTPQVNLPQKEPAPYVPPISDAEVRSLFQPHRKNPGRLTWRELKQSPSRLQAVHNIYFQEMRAAMQKVKNQW